MSPQAAVESPSHVPLTLLPEKENAIPVRFLAALFFHSGVIVSTSFFSIAFMLVFLLNTAGSE